MNKTNLLSTDTLKTIAQGALGAMTFGVYHQYTSNKMMELNNAKLNLQYKIFMDKMELHHNKEMNELREKINKLEQKRGYWT